ncbi:MAG: aminotransferase class V-fold PLP-dependent enzyme [SAR324 cluster bacterium]|nr:aminotransferase class V-fold PLP-dependent enzyme [SAR324 cluster bacterium]
MIYFDAAASVPPDPKLWAALAELNAPFLGNPSSTHPMGRKAKEVIEGVRSQFAKTFSVPKEAVLFCSGGTESINMALKGIVKASNTLLISPLEHPAVTNAAKALEEAGCGLELLSLTPEGLIDLEGLKAQLKSKPNLVSIQAQNSETGLMQKVNEIGRLIKQESPKTLFHVDGVQAFTKSNLTIKNIDLLSISGHKFRALTGVGLLILGSNLALKCLQDGGGQEFGLRSGTENVNGIFSLGFAAKEAFTNVVEKQAKVEVYAKALLDYLQSELNWVEPYQPLNKSPYVVSLWLKGLLGEVALNHLGQQGVMVSTGSACNARTKKLSSTLKILGFSDQRIKESIRLSFHPDFLEVAPEVVGQKMVATLRELKALMP